VSRERQRPRARNRPDDRCHARCVALIPARSYPPPTLSAQRYQPGRGQIRTRGRGGAWRGGGDRWEGWGGDVWNIAGRMVEGEARSNLFGFGLFGSGMFGSGQFGSGQVGSVGDGNAASLAFLQVF